MKRLAITTDCVCDLPEEYLTEHDVDLVYFYINTDTGRFQDGAGITSGNILEYLEEGGVKAETCAPRVEEYQRFFEEQLTRSEELLHISIGGRVGESCKNAMTARKLLGDDAARVTVIDSGHVSTGMGHMIVKAVELRDGGKSTAEIAAAIERMRSKVSTTFITRNANYLYRNGRVSARVRQLCGAFRLHPVIELRDGRMVLKAMRVGQYEKAMLRYVRDELKRGDRIDKRRLFITHAGCSVRTVSLIRAEVAKLCEFEEVVVTRQSATVSSNFGPETLGIIFVYK